MVVIGEERVALAAGPRLTEGLRGELSAAFARVVESGEFVQAVEVDAFEADFARTQGPVYAVATGSGTAALHLALLAVDAGPGSEVIIPANAPVTVANAVAAAGARAVAADIEPVGFAIDPHDVERRITGLTRAVVAVHRFGEMANVGELGRVMQRHGIALVEEATEAVGAVLDGASAGTIGDVGCFGFGGHGNLATTGNGGAVTTARPELAERIRAARLAFDCRMGEVEGAALRVIAPHVPEWNAARQAAAALYESELSRAPVVLPGGGVYSRYVIRTRYRYALRQYLEDEGIGSAVPTGTLNAEMAAEFPNAWAAEREALALPMHPLITPDEVLAVTRAVRQFGKFSAAMASEAALGGMAEARL